MNQLRVTLNQLRRWYDNPETWPSWLGFLDFETLIPKQIASWAREGTPEYEQSLARWERRRRIQPKCPEGFHYMQVYTFGVLGSPDVFVFRVEPPCKCQLYRKETIQVEQTQLVPC